jgi:hypothetical protein
MRSIKFPFNIQLSFNNREPNGMTISSRRRYLRKGIGPFCLTPNIRIFEENSVLVGWDLMRSIHFMIMALLSCVLSMKHRTPIMANGHRLWLYQSSNFKGGVYSELD